MKATSKLISVVLILALCLSMFTVSAFAATPVAGGDASKVFQGIHPGAKQPQVADQQEDAQSEAQEEPAETKEAVAKEGFVAVATAEELMDALEANAASIQLTEQIDWVGTLELDYDVTIDLGGKGKGLAFSGSGDAAVVSSAHANLLNGNLFVSGDVAATESSAAVPGFQTVAAGVDGGTVYLNGVYVSFANAGENVIFGRGVSLGSGVFSQDVSAYYGEEAANSYDFTTTESGMYDVTAKPVPTAADEDDDNDIADGNEADGKVVSLTGEYGEGADKIVVTVSGKNLPDGLRVSVTPMDKSELQVSGDKEVLFVVDITLYDEENNVYEPADDPNVPEVNVTIRHPALGNVEEGEEVTLYHIVKGEAVPVTEPEEIAGQDTVEFSTTSFSPYGATTQPVYTGSDGDVHYREVKVIGEDIALISAGIELEYTGNQKPIAVSIVPYEDALSGDYNIYQHGLLLSDGTDYTLTNNKLTILPAALTYAPEGKFGIVFWYQDQGTMVYIVQPVILVNEEGVFGVGDNFTPEDTAHKGTTGTFDVEMCDAGSVKIKMTGDLVSFKITGGDCGPVEYNAPQKKVKIGDKTYSASELFSVDENYATDPMGHEFVNGKVLTLSQTLIKLLGFHDDKTVVMNPVVCEGKEGDKTGGPFYLNIAPGITVADGLDDYIKGKNLWVKFQSCAPIDYDADGTLAIWIGGQKISHEYYSISNDHCTLWIYRNLLDQLKSNNRYTLKARLWAYSTDPATGKKYKETWYPATASFNVLAAGSTSSKSPKTGDESNIALWASVLVLSGGAVIALIPKKKSGVK